MLSPLFFLSRSLSNSTPPSLNLLLFSPLSLHFPHARSIFLPPSSLSPSFSLLRITLQSESVWTEGSLSAGIVDTLSTVEQLSQWEKGSEAETQTVTQSKHSPPVFVDFMCSWACEQQHTAKQCSTYMCMLLTTWWAYIWLDSWRLRTEKNNLRSFVHAAVISSIASPQTGYRGLLVCLEAFSITCIFAVALNMP